MGNVRLGIDVDKVIELRDRYNLRAFVETGTYKMGTALLAAQHFDQVVTIEGYEPRYRKNMASFAGNPPLNIDFVFGDSRDLLAGVLAQLDAPALLWLDAHWCGNSEYSGAVGDECPLEAELKAVFASKYANQHVILIDDARLFTAPPPYPHDPAQWPTYADIQRLLAPRKLYIEDDVIYAEPV